MSNYYQSENEQYQNQLYDELEKFNWGAFLLNIIWAIPNGAIKNALPTLVLMLICCILSKIPLFGIVFIIANICLAVYMGKKGNEWSWDGKKWENLDEFVKVQKNWGGFAPIGFILLSVVISMIISSLTTLYGLQNAKKIIAKEKSILETAVARIVTAPNFDTFKSGEDIAKYFIENDTYKWHYAGKLNSVFVEKIGPYHVILYFEKDGECSLNENNCYVELCSKYKSSITPFNKAYFDNDGIIEFEK